jgi:hypothetical protein
MSGGTRWHLRVIEPHLKILEMLQERYAGRVLRRLRILLVRKAEHRENWIIRSA